MPKSDKTTFALFFGNRGFFPGSLMESAREEMVRVLNGLGHKTLILDANATRFGGVETVEEGKTFANFLRAHEGEFGGVILSLPNFGDENGAVAALQNANVPILIQAYPDELSRMGPESRRDAFCGKMSIMDVFYQHDIPYTALPPHTVSPSSKTFAAQIDYFDRVCRVANGVYGMTVGAVGARTSPFKTVRFDELALQRNGITVETYDLSDIFNRMDGVKESDAAYKDKAAVLKEYSDWSRSPQEAFPKLVKLGVVLDALVEEAGLDALAVRCWLEMQKVIGISPCVVMSEMNSRGIVAACEVDVGNAVAMYALALASRNVAACLDWNNNYGEEQDKCILFHCGPVPQPMMADRGVIDSHAILDNVLGPGCSFGCNTGRIKAMPFSFASMMTDEGGLRFYAGEGNFTEDFIPDDFFGCAGVAKINGLQEVLLYAGREGHRHHVSVTPGHVAAPVNEALQYYLGYEVALLCRENCD